MAKMVKLSVGEVKFNEPTARMLRAAMDMEKGEGSRAFFIIGECTNMSLDELDKLSLNDINTLSEVLSEFQQKAPSINSKK